MASEILAIPEEQLQEVITVIRNGLTITSNLNEKTIIRLTEWCDGEEKFLNEK